MTSGSSVKLDSKALCQTATNYLVHVIMVGFYGQAVLCNARAVWIMFSEGHLVRESASHFGPRATGTGKRLVDLFTSSICRVREVLLQYSVIRLTRGNVWVANGVCILRLLDVRHISMYVAKLVHQHR